MSLTRKLVNSYHDQIDRCQQELTKLGVGILPLTCENLKTLSENNYEVVVIIAHHDQERNALVLANGKRLSTSFVIDSLAEYQGIVDLSCCFTDTVLSEIKAKYSDNIHGIASPNEIDLGRTLFVLPFIIKKYYECGDYREAFFTMHAMFGQVIAKNPELIQDTDSGALGEIHAAAYSPLYIRLEVPETIPFAIWDDGTVSIEDINNEAKGFNPKAQNSIRRLLSNLGKGDKITIEITFPKVNPNMIEVIGESKLPIKWQGETISVGFIIFVKQDYKKESITPVFEVRKGTDLLTSIGFTLLIEDNNKERPRGDIGGNQYKPGRIAEQFKPGRPPESMFKNNTDKEKWAKEFTEFLKFHKCQHDFKIEAKKQDYISMAFVSFYVRWIDMKRNKDGKNIVEKSANGRACFRFLTDDCKTEDNHIGNLTPEKQYGDFIRREIADRKDGIESVFKEIKEKTKKVDEEVCDWFLKRRLYSEN